MSLATVPRVNTAWILSLLFKKKEGSGVSRAFLPGQVPACFSCISFLRGSVCVDLFCVDVDAWILRRGFVWREFCGLSQQTIVAPLAAAAEVGWQTDEGRAKYLSDARGSFEWRGRVHGHAMQQSVQFLVDYTAGGHD